MAAANTENDKEQRASDALSVSAVAPEETSIPEPEGETTIIATDYEIGQDNIAHSFELRFDIHQVVFTVSALAVVAFTFLTLAFQNDIGPLFVGMRTALTTNFAWLFLSVGNVCVLLCLALILSPLGRIRLGGPEATPDYGYLGWFAMLFAAGMGIGLVFYGVSEPISHFEASLSGSSTGPDGVRTDSAPLGGATGDTLAARRLSMAATIYHWGLHPWAIYGVVALALGLFCYNKQLPFTLRSAFYPLFGERIWGWPGHVIDILAIFATVFGLATSLGIGAKQAAAGLDYLFGIGTSPSRLVILVIVITAVATASIVAGLDRGVKRLSEINIALALLLLAFIILAGPTATIAQGVFANLWAYLTHLPALSQPIGRSDINFVSDWTSFYWAWWISWSPFVGMFIARVSRGRTVREFLIAVLIVPALASVIWMTAMGGTAISLTTGGFSGVTDAALELKLFVMLTQLPLTAIASFIGIVLVIVFFITSADSGSLVVDTIAAGGKINAPVAQRVFWATFTGLVAISLLLGGGLTALQAMAVCTGLPFALVLLGACYTIVQGLLSEPR